MINTLYDVFYFIFVGAVSAQFLFYAFLLYAAAINRWEYITTTAKVLMAPLLILYLFDCLFNWIFGGIIFVESPLMTWTFTARCTMHLADSGRRGSVANWVCGILNPFQIGGHCIP